MFGGAAVRVAIEHTTRLEYSADVVEGVMDARLGPFSDADQRWETFELRANPSAAVRPYHDGFGNAAHLITIARPHRFIEVVTCSRVQTLLDDPFPFPVTPLRPLGPSDLADYLAPSSMVPELPALQALAAPHHPTDPAAAFDAVRVLMGVVYRGFTYRKHVTDVATTVADVVANRIGVCQDFAHVLIGLCRAVGIPARYVSGYVVVQRQSQSQSQSQRSGTGTQSQSQSQSRSHAETRRAQGPDPTPSSDHAASHAWIEAWTPTHGWRGFDPTNDLVASQNHVKMALGRDYSDIPPTRGTFRGAAEEHLTVDVVTRVED